MRPAKRVVSPVGDVVEYVFHRGGFQEILNIFFFFLANRGSTLEKSEKSGEEEGIKLEKQSLKTPDVGKFLGWASGGARGFHSGCDRKKASQELTSN